MVMPCQVVLELADLHGAGGQYEVLIGNRIEDVGGGNVLGLQQPRNQVDHHLALLATIGVGNDSAGYRNELGTQEVLTQVIEALLGEALARKTELQNRHAGGAVVDDDGR